MRIWFVLGTAAELIKVYPLIQGCIEKRIPWTVVSSGQSGENFWKQWDEFQLPRENTLSLVPSQSDLRHSFQAGRWLVKALFAGLKPMRELARDDKQHRVVVHGDTLTTVVGAWWAWQLGWPIAHVEAGLRSKHWWQPFPEEINRRVVSRLARLHFAPDQVAQENLLKARVKGTVINTGGNSLLDAVRSMEHANQTPATRKPLVVANLHRYENLNSPIRWRVLVDTVVAASRDYQVIMVLHPQTKHKLDSDSRAYSALVKAGVELRPRMMFKSFLSLLTQAEFLITDGGSNQEECYYLGKPCLVLRQTTERQEGLGTTTVMSNLNPLIIAEFLKEPKRFKHAPALTDQRPSQIMLEALNQPLDQGRAHE